MTFKSLITLIRYASIDMGIEIAMDLDDIRTNAASLSKKHWALGTIHYGDNDNGHLLYIKASMTGDENEYVRDYKTHHAAFPHQSTADQFFDETQFEVYRALGEHIAKDAFDSGEIDHMVAVPVVDSQVDGA